MVTSRPHTLSHLQSSRWFLSLPKRMVSLDIQGLSEEGVESFIHSYVDARQYSDNDSRLYAVTNHSGKNSFSILPLDDDGQYFQIILNPNSNYVYISCIGHHEIDERQCGDTCACQKLQDRARNDPYIFSLAPNPFYLWLICTVSKRKFCLFQSVNQNDDEDGYRKFLNLYFCCRYTLKLERILCQRP